MSLGSVRGWLAVAAVLAVAARGGAARPARPTAAPAVRYANIGGYLLAYECAGTGRALEARAQTRLALLSADSIHVLDRGIGHLIPALDPRIVIAATTAVLAAAASGLPLARCPQVFRSVPTADCLHRGQLAHQQT